jgi:16S rRNA (guanine527-N7)-methyltransferase
MIRHVADSLLFSRFLPTATPVWDLGTGVGLPGIPLALLRPSQSFVLVERSRRRVSLVRRAVRILDLENVEVVEGDIHQLAAGSIGAMVARASLRPEVMGVIVQRCVRSGGIAVVGGSWVRKPISPGWETVPVPRDVLDHDIWLLIMRRQ